MGSKRIELKDKIEWRNEQGLPHRLDGPAIEYPNGDKEWWVNGLYHRLDGPAIENINGDKEWLINGERHREDGPAIEWNDDDKWYYLNGIRYREEEWKEEVIKLKLNRIKDL